MPRKRTASSTAKSKKGTASAHRPLQDITETVLLDQHEDNLLKPDSGRPKRRAKVPTGALGQKLKRPVPASSLPPSSPIPSSNYLPIASSVVDGGDDNNAITPSQETQGTSRSFWADEVVEDNWKENIDFSSQCYDENGEFIVPQVEEEERVPLGDSDPFGFFAVEEKLKVERAKQPPSAPKAPSPSKPPSKPTLTQPVKPPRTPHKQRVGKRPLSASLSSRDSSPARSQLLLSSPSPTKRSSERFNAQRETELEIPEESAPVETDADDSPSKATGRRKRPRLSDSPVNPERLAKSLTSLLPKRRGRGKVYYEEDDDDEEVEFHTRKRATRGRRKLKDAKHQEEEEGEEVDLDERMAQERQARLAYFKKLQNYEVARENVYVV
ncbi:hypothetical protein AAF712_000291 [Marasmius tenuissimus]|uniref:Uncharacterized protein n=1 Tax=Marasmius tenuissimus TaxID=585030 RepID=A0ABR3AHP9_9AGAR